MKQSLRAHKRLLFALLLCVKFTPVQQQSQRSRVKENGTQANKQNIWRAFTKIFNPLCLGLLSLSLAGSCLAHFLCIHEGHQKVQRRPAFLARLLFHPFFSASLFLGQLFSTVFSFSSSSLPISFTIFFSLFFYFVSLPFRL